MANIKCVYPFLLVVGLIIILVAIYFSTNTRIDDEQLEKLIQTDSGQVQGSTGQSRDGRQFFQWLKIPYAQPPLGRLRFASPKPVEKWEGILNGTAYGPKCAQLGPTGFVGDEDCLHVNIFVPKLKDLDEGTLLPVVVWIHGGAFVDGSATDYGPDYFMDENVVLVTINYRLNLFGFLTTGDSLVRGNMGLKDQKLALEWLQKNIENFYGDPSKITIMGESAGGASVHHLVMSPKTSGLFQKAVSLSGVATSVWAFRSVEVGLERTTSFAKRMDCPTKNSEEMVECLRSFSASQLLLQAFKPDIDDIFIFDPTRGSDFLAPIVEPIDDEDAYLVESPLDRLVQGKAQRIPWLTGVLADEGVMTSLAFNRDPSKLDSMDDNWEKNMELSLLIKNLPEKSRKEICSKVRQFYFPKETYARMTVDEKIDNYTRLYSAAFFNTYLSQTAKIQRQFSNVYLYHFSKRGGPSIIGTVFGPDKTKYYGVCHADDLTYLFPYGGHFEIPKDDENDIYQFSKGFVSIIAQFAADENSMKFRNVHLTPTPKEGKLKYLNIDDTTEMVDEPVEESNKFWLSLNMLQQHSEVVKKSTRKFRSG